MVTMGLASICLQPLFILITPLSFLMISVLEAAHTAVVTKNLSAWDAVKHGFGIVREHLWKYLILTIIIYFGITIISSFLMFPMLVPLMGFPIFAESGGDVGNSPLMVIAILFLCIFFPTLLKTALDLTYLRLTQKAENQVIVNQS